MFLGGGIKKEGLWDKRKLAVAAVENFKVINNQVYTNIIYNLRH